MPTAGALSFWASRLVSARRWFTGPVREAATEAELASIERSYDTP